MNVKRNVILLVCGCFNPATYMHFRMFELAKDQLQKTGKYNVIKGIVSPVSDSYAKKGLTASAMRVDMLRLALRGNPWICVDSWECEQRNWLRTRIVLDYHQADACGYSFGKNDDGKWPTSSACRIKDEDPLVMLLCGADLLHSFAIPGLWSSVELEHILTHGIVVISRVGYDTTVLLKEHPLLSKHSDKIVIVHDPIQNAVSSTAIRNAVGCGESVRYLLPDDVLHYVYQHRLYFDNKLSCQQEKEEV